MNAIFADTYYFLALLNPNDQFHKQAIEMTAELDRILTTEWILTELADALSAPGWRQAFLKLYDGMARREDITIIEFDKSIGQAGLRLYRRRNDKSWSLTDCVSFAVMRENEIDTALTGDHHFTQAGFKILFPD